MSSSSDKGAVTGPSRVNVTFFELVEWQRQLREIRDRTNAWIPENKRRLELVTILSMAAGAGVKALEELLSD